MANSTPTWLSVWIGVLLYDQPSEINLFHSLLASWIIHSFAVEEVLGSKNRNKFMLLLRTILICPFTGWLNR